MSILHAKGLGENTEAITRVADAIFARLKQETDVVFFVPGGQSMFLVDALGHSGIRHVSAIHEQGAGCMAIGYAIATGKLGVCLTTSGPGVTNAITPCLAAWMDSIPVLFISGQARTPTLVGESGLRTRGVQECDTVSIVEPIVKMSQEVDDIESALYWIDKMPNICMTGRRGPCWLSVPQDIQGIEL